MAELSVDRLRGMLGREGSRAEAAERQVRDQAAEIARLRARIGELQSDCDRAARKLGARR